MSAVSDGVCVAPSMAATTRELLRVSDLREGHLGIAGLRVLQPGRPLHLAAELVGRSSLLSLFTSIHIPMIGADWKSRLRLAKRSGRLQSEGGLLLRTGQTPLDVRPPC